MKAKRPQFVKMTVSREENPPPREVCCPDYRNCLTEAAFKNFCLDCSQCAEIGQIDEGPPVERNSEHNRGRRLHFGMSLPG